MAADCTLMKQTSSSEDTENESVVNSVDGVVKRRLSFSSEKDISVAGEPNILSSVQSLQNVSNVSSTCRLPDDERAELPSDEAVDKSLGTENTTKDNAPKQDKANSTQDKENAALPSTDLPQENTQEDTSDQDSNKRHTNTEERDAEVVKRAWEEGCVNVVFPGAVTQDSCYRFVVEILKCILYQRQQLPMTYDQLVYSQKKRQTSAQDKDAVIRRPMQSADTYWRKCQQTLQDLEEVLQQLEVLFSLSRIPRVLLLMGGSIILPKELYEINMEALVLGGGDQSLRVSSCLRQLFRTLFVADLLSDNKPVRLMPTTVLALAHRECGVGWFRPKLQFKIPTRVKNQTISLTTDPSTCKKQGAEGSDWQDYVWFQAPMAIMGLATDPKS